MPTTNHPPKAPNATKKPLGRGTLRSGAQTQPCLDVVVSELSGAVRNICSEYADSEKGRTVLFAVCLIIIEDMMKGQPTDLRQVWASKLYQLADVLAAGGDTAET